MMKTFTLFPICLFLVCISANAGNMFGPAPFRGGSPLVTGTDGVYQAVATAPNLTGLFSWAINGGVQTTDAVNNRWVFFVDGEVLTGSTIANVSEEKIAGVLDSSVPSGVPTAEDGSVQLPIGFVVPGNEGSGQFQGKINLKSPVAAFKGSGTITGAPARTDQLVVVSENLLDEVEVADLDVEEIEALLTPSRVIDINIPGSELENVQFQFRGTRLSLSAPQGQAQPALN